MDEAERCGQTAIKLAPKDFYPYNLLGAVYFQRGDPEEGDKYFQVASACDFIVTYDKRDFEGAEQFGMHIVTAKEFLQEIGELP